MGEIIEAVIGLYYTGGREAMGQNQRVLCQAADMIVTIEARQAVEVIDGCDG